MSTVDRLSPGDAERIARRAKRAAVGAEVTTLSRSQATRVIRRCRRSSTRTSTPG